MHRGWYAISSRAVAGTRSLSSRHLPLLPRRGSPALTVPGWLCRVRGWGGAGAAGGLARPAPPSGPRVSAPLLSGYLALAFRRGGLKTPGGSPYRPRGRGGGGARREGRSSAGGLPGSSPRPALPQTQRAPSPAAGASRGGGRGGRVASPLWAPEGFPARAPGLSRPLAGRRRAPGSWRPVSRVSRLSVSDPVFFFSHVCLVSFLAGRPEAEPPRRRAPLFPRRRGGRGALVAVVSTRVSPLTPQITDTTLSGGSLGSCVDEERS